MLGRARPAGRRKKCFKLPIRYARLVGRDNVIAGTDCGLGGRVGHPKIVWAKFEALAEGARLATQQLWGR